MTIDSRCTCNPFHIRKIYVETRNAPRRAAAAQQQACQRLAKGPKTIESTIYDISILLRAIEIIRTSQSIMINPFYLNFVYLTVLRPLLQLSTT